MTTIGFLIGSTLVRDGLASTSVVLVALGEDFLADEGGQSSSVVNKGWSRAVGSASAVKGESVLIRKLVGGKTVASFKESLPRHRCLC